MSKNNLKFEFKNIWNSADKDLKSKIMDMGEDYKVYLNNAKTEREAVNEIVSRAKEKGFVDINEFISQNRSVEFGDKIYAVNRNKAVVLYVIGKELIENGVRIVGGHIDSPRLDLKPNPLYEKEEMALFKTHYYGGVKKYQWVSRPLSLHGRIMKQNGEYIDIAIGENENDPVFFISDLLPHLSADQYKKTIGEGITGEGLNLLVGSIPSLDENEKEPFKAKILEILNTKYDITELDLITSELEIVPAGKARDLGFDRSLVLGYGQDDSACSYSSMKAILDVENPRYTAVGMYMDKEEIGSMGNTGSESSYFENTLAELINLQVGSYTELMIRRCLNNTKVLSADVTAAFDPNFPEVLDPLNASRINHGIGFCKYTGTRGKGGTNDANAEFFREVVDIFNENDVIWHVGELGKVDQGGGGTIAFILANRGADVIDCGVPVLSMHGTFEVSAKADIYMAYKAYKVFFEAE
ncbi:MAG: aminopeptidase [Clostridiales bacterium]|nr:MAG: aminopeptidase [Clostridiales bacterium]